MGKMMWDKFVGKYGDPIGFVARVSSSLPKGIDFDENKRKLPTPYGLFIEWCKRELRGDWSSAKMQGGFHICVASEEDAEKIVERFKISSQSPKKTVFCDRVFPLLYQNPGYKDLAKELGYKLK